MVLYDAVKNLLIVAVLMLVKKRQIPQGVRTGIFLFLYAFFRIFVDIFREYPTSLVGLATGQVLNIAFSILGLALMVVPMLYGRDKSRVSAEPSVGSQEDLAATGLRWRRLVFAVLLLFSLVMPSDWTQDVPSRYGKRHPSVSYSIIYPKIDPSPKIMAPNNRFTYASEPTVDVGLAPSHSLNPMLRFVSIDYFQYFVH